MIKRFSFWGLALAGFLILKPSWAASAPDQDPAACLRDVQRVCVQMEDHLETCLDQRGDQLPAGCRDSLKAAMSLAQDPSGPGACIADVQRFCPSLPSDTLAQCMTDKMSQFSDACQKYLQRGQH